MAPRRKWKKPGEPLTPDEEAAVYQELSRSFRDRVTKGTAIDPLTGCFCLHGPVLTYGRSPIAGTILNPYPGVPKPPGVMGKRLPTTYMHARVAMAMVTGLFPTQLPAHWNLRGLKPMCWNPTCWNPLHFDFGGLIPDEEIVPLLEAYKWKVYSFATYVDVPGEAYLEVIGKTGQELLGAASLESTAPLEE
jgi:hypothetical protein